MEAGHFDRVNQGEELFVRHGKSCAFIAQKFSVTVRAVEKWASRYRWMDKRKAWQSTPRTVGLTLREKLQERMAGICGVDGLKLEDAEEIERIGKLIDRMEKEGYQFSAAAVEVIGEFAKWLRAQPIQDEEYQVVSNWLQAWLQRILC